MQGWKRNLEKKIILNMTNGRLYMFFNETFSDISDLCYRFHFLFLSCLNFMNRPQSEFIIKK